MIEILNLSGQTAASTVADLPVHRIVQCEQYPMI
jgi:hypothetical protein